MKAFFRLAPAVRPPGCFRFYGKLRDRRPGGERLHPQHCGRNPKIASNLRFIPKRNKQQPRTLSHSAYGGSE
jgi:hypothetical protein